MAAFQPTKSNAVRPSAELNQGSGAGLNSKQQSRKEPTNDSLQGPSPPKSHRSTKTSVTSQSSLPLQWIDEQELRQNKSGLRKTVRSYARRDTCLRRKQLNAASKPGSKAPRNIIEKDTPEPQGGPTGEEEHSGRLSPLIQHSKAETYTNESSRVPQTNITNINKLALDPKTTTGDTSAETNLAFRTVKDQYKDSPPRHHIRSVAVCRSRVLKRNTPSPGTKQAFLHKTPVETCSALVDTVYSRDLSDVFINQASDPPSLNAKNILLSGSWRDDPFDIHGLVNNPRVSLLLSHHQESIGSTWRPHVNRAFLDWSFSSDVLLHSLLYFAASHLYRLTNCLTLRYDVLHHKGEVLRIINESLDNPERRTTDAIIGALAYLVLYEEMYGSKEAADFHRKGLKRLLDLRLNMPGPALNFFLTKMLPITGVQYSIQEDTSTPAIDRTSHSDANTITSQCLPHNPTIESLRVVIPSNAMYEVFTWLKNSFRLVSHLPLDAPNRKSESYLIRQKITSYLKNLDTNLSFPKRDSCRSWLLASMIYIHIITATSIELELLWESEKELVGQLKETLELVIESKDGIDYSCPVLLWVLLFGMLPARGGDRAWFGQALETALRVAEVDGWEEMRERLKALPWVQEYVEERLEALCSFDGRRQA